MRDANFPHGAQIRWENLIQHETQWNEIATWGIEYFGLPGDRYITDVGTDQMTWWFKDPRDQTIFILRNGQATCTELSLST